MCTAFSCIAEDHYFGRNLDLDYHYDEKITITPRAYPFHFRHVEKPKEQFTMMGIATIVEGVPLYYDAVNEMGLCMAGLNFPGNAKYHRIDPKKNNIAAFELIPWVLRQCETVYQAKELLANANICQSSFSDDLPPTPLHWIISDAISTITVEPLEDRLEIRENHIGVLTNNPPFYFHANNLVNYMNLSRQQPLNRFSGSISLEPYSLGMGAIGLPGDFSSSSRFVRCSFLKENSIFGDNENNRVGQVFHILDGVSQFEGCVETKLGFEKTLYSICCNATKGIYYYTTYHNRQIHAVDLFHEDLNGTDLIAYPLFINQEINYQN